MATTSRGAIAITFTAPTAPGVVGQNSYAIAENTTSPGTTELKDLSSGANTITPPSGGTPKGVLIQPPASNAVALTLKGISGDTGIALHLTNPTYIALSSPTATFVITTGGAIADVLFVWT